MTFQLKNSVSKFVTHLRDPLYSNSLYMMLTTVFTAFAGFIFWMIAAKFYTPEDVGIATAIISTISLIILFSRFGLDFSIIRFFPDRDKSKVFCTSTIITTAFGLFFGIIFILGIDFFAPELYILKSPINAVIYLTIIFLNSFTIFAGISYLANRKAAFQFIQSIATGSRFIFLIPFVALGPIGILSAFGTSLLLAFFLAIYLIARSGIKIIFSIDYNFLRDSFHFSFGNYFVGLFKTAPNMILPLMILNTLGAEDTAYYYIVFAISSLLFTISSSISTSLFIEGSHGVALKKSIFKSLFITFSFLIPSMMTIYFFGGWMLKIIGKEYAVAGIYILQLMVLVSLLMVAINIYFAIKRIQKDIKEIMIISGIIGIILILTVYALMPIYGLVGVGYAWILSYAIGNLIIGIKMWNQGWFKSNKEIIT